MKALLQTLKGYILALISFLREVLSEDGKGSWSRTGSAVIVLAYAYIVVATRSIPERTEELAFVLAALYGVNQVKHVAGTLVQLQRRGREESA